MVEGVAMAFRNKAMMRGRRLQREAQRSGNAWKDDPYLVGDAAAHDGLAIHTNPHPPGTEEHMDWANGWLESRAHKK
jgi:hypothetical protein